MTELIKHFDSFCPYVDELNEKLENVIFSLDTDQNKNDVITTNLDWPSYLHVGYNIAPIILIVKFQKSRLYKKTKMFINEQVKDLGLCVQNMFLYAMTDNSRIDWHTDGTPEREAGLSLYLNKTWEDHMGGIFEYEEVRGYRNNTIFKKTPKYNEATLVFGSTRHRVTPVQGDFLRKSLQVWLEKI